MLNPQKYIFKMGGSRLKSNKRTFIKEWRLHRGISQVTLSERVGISQTNISKLELGAISYTQPVLEAIADALCCSPADLIMRDPTRAVALWSVISTLDEAQSEQAARVIEALVKKTA